ncbi:MAG: TIGR04282 family arsenosugar biosynthesis glycosyltransferase [Candidatus Methanoperedens sp.]|nr:TIGR04282 family arsenosugar biosynthesis glycosyltransferase [Candidatus Methanoperedens sp.]MCZ7371280.1 TIGR04282 family arsenosugar biosynthesis glycosyltransferase [Candidatus Methanoperedens sp.]
MDAIVIMAKAPLPNEVKTRLTPPLKPEAAARLYHNFLLDKIEQVKTIKEAQPFLAYTPVAEEKFFRSIIPPAFTLISQVGADLGERLANISNILFDRGFEKVVMLDSDTPNLPPDYIREALRRLDEVDIVIGPCEDGGYFLAGMKRSIPELFKGIPWSTSEVTSHTVKKARAMGLLISQIEKWYDVDTMDDLSRLKRDMSSGEEKGSFFAANTFNFLSGMKID